VAITIAAPIPTTIQSGSKATSRRMPTRSLKAVTTFTFLSLGTSGATGDRSRARDRKPAQTRRTDILAVSLRDDERAAAVALRVVTTAAMAPA
jgi:hypothetical protein